MCCAVKRIALLLLVVVVVGGAAIGSDVAPTNEECEALTRRLHTKDLPKVFGDWGLVRAVADHEHGSNLLANLTSSRANFHLLIPNGKTVVYKERNVFNDNSCTLYFINLQIPSESSDSGDNILQVKGGIMLKYGLVHDINSGTVEFYETCPDCLLMIFKDPLGRFLLSHRREGHHSDVEHMKAAHDNHRKLSECLGFAHNKEFSFSGAAVCTKCEGVNTRLPTKDLHKIYGDWVLVWSVSDIGRGQDLLPNVSSSYVELQLLHDQKTVVFNERNVYTDNSCSNYIINLTLPSDPSDSEHLTLHTVSATVEEDGVVKPYDDSAELDFYETCSDCLLVVYKNIHGRYLLSYRREGRHSDVDQLKASHDGHRQQAECLGFAHDKVFSYDGVAAVGYQAVPTCKKCASLKTRLPTKDLQKIFGDWVLVWSVSDYEKGWDLLQNVSSSHVELQLLHDQKTVVFNERNLYTDKSCSNYIINLALPPDSSDAEHHTLHMVSATVERHDVVKPYDDSAELDFYETCSDCLLVVYKNIHGRYLLSYKREGHHSDADQLRAAHHDHRKQSECLGFEHDKPFSYDGVADFCHKKSSPAVKHQLS